MAQWCLAVSASLVVLNSASLVRGDGYEGRYGSQLGSNTLRIQSLLPANFQLRSDVRPTIEIASLPLLLRHCFNKYLEASTHDDLMDILTQEHLQHLGSDPSETAFGAPAGEGPHGMQKFNARQEKEAKAAALSQSAVINRIPWIGSEAGGVSASEHGAIVETAETDEFDLDTSELEHLFEDGFEEEDEDGKNPLRSMVGIRKSTENSQHSHGQSTTTDKEPSKAKLRSLQAISMILLEPPHSSGTTDTNWVRKSIFRTSKDKLIATEHRAVANVANKSRQRSRTNKVTKRQKQLRMCAEMRLWSSSPTTF
ncbi:hypothetical protein EDD11_003696 [Mortierella claussenii]|nr:hypothetical protein EDD11_003696 [Mortierella claussenii]